MSETFGDRPRLTKDERNKIIEAFLRDPVEGTRLAVERGLTANYAYKAAYERGLLPRSTKYWGKLVEQVPQQ